MARTEVEYRLEHEGGASDEIYRTFCANVPRVGEYVSIDTTRIIHYEVFDVNWTVGEGEESAIVWLVCRGDNEYCDWGCSTNRQYDD